MALEVSMTGTGSIGDLTPNWTVNEFITPVAIGSTSSGTGSVSFNAKANEDSLLCINNNIVSTVNGFGTVEGVIQSVSESGLNVSLTHGSLLDKLNLDVSVPPFLGGDVVSALDYFEQAVLGNARTTKTSGQFFTLAGHGYCFVNDGSNKAVFQDASVVYRDPVFGIEGDTNPSYAYYDIRNTVSANNFVRNNGKVYANDVSGHFFYSDGGFGVSTQMSRLFYKTVLDGADNVFSFVGNPPATSFSWDLELFLTIDYSAETIELSGNYSPGGFYTPFSSSASIAALDVDAELAVFFQYGVEAGGVYKLRATICNTSNYASSVTVTQDLSYSSTPIIEAWSVDGLVRDLYVENNTPSYSNVTPAEWGIASTFYSDTATNTFGKPSVAYTGVFWEYLQMGCAAYSQEVSVVNNVVVVRDVGASTFDITNVVASPTMTPTSTLSGRQINIPYTDSRFVSGTVYSAENDGNNIISVRAGETTVTSVKHTVNPIYVTQPTRSDTWPITSGQYYVIDSSGVRLLAGEWEEYGASVTVKIDPDDPAAIQITVVGPYTDTTLAGGPYELAASSGSNKYASLEIAGTGVYSGEGVLGLLTGLDPDKYTRATVNTITNPFIADVEQAYDRGVWAAQKASGPLVTMSAQIPSSSIDGIGLTCGSLISYRNSTYRITSCSISGIGANITAERHVMVQNIDAIWGTGITAPKTFTVTLASPAVFTSSGHGLANGKFVSFSTTGQLPNDAATSSTIWGGYVINSSTDTFQLSATSGGSAINSTGSQSGTHSFITGNTSVAEYDGFWENYECQDQIIFPYLEA